MIDPSRDRHWEPRAGHRQGRRHRTVGLAAAAALILTLAAVAPVSSARASVDTPQVTTRQVCFEVHNGADHARVLGTRFSMPQTDMKTVILLVHGHSVTSRYWDLRPSYSIARRLARTGYLVISYDRLTAGASTYPIPAPGSPEDPGSAQANSVSFDNDRNMISEIVEQIRGTYLLPRTDCAENEAAGAGANTRVILVGHSQGAAIVSGYDGKWRAVAPIDALVQAGWSNAGLSDEGASRVSADFQNQANYDARQISLFLDPGSTRARNSISAARCASNIRLLLYDGMPTAREASAAVCDPATFETVPYLGLASVVPAGEENRALIPQTDPALPVLLTWSDHDGFFPTDPSKSTVAGQAPVAPCDPTGMLSCQATENQFWLTHHPGRVTVWNQPDCGHSFNLCSNMPAWTGEVVSWLAANGLAPVSSTSDQGP